ncbi:FKBP-type peptidyl-prolyl cis-trans isomerase [Flavobacterium sp.]|uniref:FKBP-type peptidyl-prolyl cis-trans isomerase n=1 Tax=Flavobacterium sp. TaxID=239 RepID=UPI002FD93462
MYSNLKMMPNQLKTLFSFTAVLLLFVSCKKDDEGATRTPPRDRAEQYATDQGLIEEYLKNNYMTVNANMDVTVTEIPNGGTQTSIWDQTEYPLQYIVVKNDTRVSLRTDGRINDPVEYKLYYILLNEGGGQRPTTIDSTHVSYRGWNFDNEEFDRTSTPVWTSFPSDIQFISGFRQILPLMKTAENTTVNTDGTVNYSNFGNLVVFIPSGLAYYESSRSTLIRSYSNLVFQIQLKNLRYNDHDRDKILSKDELYGTQTDYFLQDTDGDGIPDFLDTNDDGDLILTRNELKIPNTNPQQYYSFDAIPDCSGNTTNPNRLKKHLDPSCN